MSTPSDQQLVQYIGQGRREALAQLFDRYCADLYDFLARLVGDRDQAARLLHEIFMRVPGAAPGFQPRDSVRGWLYSLAREAGLTWLRQRGWLDGLPPSDEPIQPGLQGDVWRAARAMPAFYRAVLIVEELHPLSPMEKARALGVNRTDLPRLVEEARNAFNRIYDAQARAEGRPTSDRIDPETVWNVRRRLPIAGGSLFGFLPPVPLPESLQLQIRRHVIEALTPREARMPPLPEETRPPLSPRLVPPEGVPPAPPPRYPPPAAPQPAPAPSAWANLPTGAIAALIGVALALAVCGAIFLLTQDRRAPIITALQPPNGATVPQTPQMNIVATFSEDREIDRSRSLLTIDGIAVPVNFVDNSIAYIGPLSVGAHTATVTLKDRAGNTTDVSWTFFVIPPGTATPSPTPLPSPTALQSPTPLILTETPLIITATPLPTLVTATPTPTLPPPAFTATPCLHASIAGVAFNDLNHNQMRDPNEPGLAGVVINLLNLNNQVLAVAISDAFGSYRFFDVPFAQYRLQALTPQGWMATMPTILLVNLFGCVTLSGIDFGFVPTPSPTATPTNTPIVVTATPSFTPIIITATPSFTPTWTPIIITATPSFTPTPTNTPTVTETPTPTPTPSFQVTNVTASVTPTSSTTCPQNFDFMGQITVIGTGTVTYQWEQSDGATSPVLTLTFLAPGTQTTPVYTWSITGAPGFNFTGWAVLKVLTPNAMDSNQATFALMCP